MIFQETTVDGVWLVEPESHHDERGFFARTYCAQTMADRGLAPCNEQWSISYSHRRGTLRGLHYRETPHSETKLVRCVRGAIFDVAVDLRPGSPTLGRYAAVELTAGNRVALYIPEGVAHGFLTLDDDTEVLYGISPAYVAASAQGIRWDDPDLGIPWPFAPEVVSERDQGLPRWRE